MKRRSTDPAYGSLELNAGLHPPLVEKRCNRDRFDPREFRRRHIGTRVATPRGINAPKRSYSL